MATENKLSEKGLRALLGKERDRQCVIADGRGMSIRVSKKGAISFVFFFRTGGRESSPVWMTLGKYPDMSLKLAREKRDQCRSWLADGRDPRNQMKLSTERTMQPVTVKQALMYWMDNYCCDNRESESNKVTLAGFERYIFPFIGDHPVEELRVSDWLDTFDKSRHKAPVSCGSAFRSAKQALKFCRKRGFANTDALNDLTTGDAGARSNKRDRLISDVELGDIWRLLHSSAGDWRNISIYMQRILKICLVFGCRQSEARLSKWSDWDLNNWVWTVPKEISKNRKEIIRPIPVAMRQWITDLHAATKRKEFILGQERKQHNVSSMATKTCVRLGHDKPENWTMHDFRRVFSTSLNDMGVDVYVIEQLLGHSLPGVMGIYNRSQYMQKKLDALNLWFTHLDNVSGFNVNVSVIKKKVG